MLLTFLENVVNIFKKNLDQYLLEKKIESNIFWKCYTNRTESKKDKNWLHYKYKNKNWNKNEAAYWVVHISLNFEVESSSSKEVQRRTRGDRAPRR